MNKDITKIYYFTQKIKHNIVIYPPTMHICTVVDCYDLSLTISHTECQSTRLWKNELNELHTTVDASSDAILLYSFIVADSEDEAISMYKKLAKEWAIEMIDSMKLSFNISNEELKND